jgi:metal-dependent amidase/aminoacylase/carboxypeptidase family protein
MPIINRIAELHRDVTAWRHDLHEHPELLYDVHRTASVVVEKLKAFGCDEVVPGIGRTGVVGVIKGRKSNSGKVIGLRSGLCLENTRQDACLWSRWPHGDAARSCQVSL